DAMSFQKGVIVGVQAELEFIRRVRFQWLRFFKAVAKATPENFVSNNQLVAAQFRVLGIVLRIDIDKLHDPVAVGARGGSIQIGNHIPRYDYIAIENTCGPGQYIRPMIDEALVLQQPHRPRGTGVGRHYRPRAVRNWIGRVRDVGIEYWSAFRG